MTNEIPKIKIGTTMGELKSLAESIPELKEGAKNSIFNFIKDEEEYGDGVISNNVELTMIKSYLADLKVDNRSWWEKLIGTDTNEPETITQVKMPDNLQANGYNDNISINNFDYEEKGLFDKNTGEFVGRSDGLPAGGEEERSVQIQYKTVRITEEVNPRTREEDNDEIVTETLSLEENGEFLESSTSRTYTSVRDGKDVLVKDSLIDFENDGIADIRKLRIDTANDGINPIEYRDSDLDGRADEKVVYTEQGEVRYERDENGKWVIKNA